MICCCRFGARAKTFLIVYDRLVLTFPEPFFDIGGVVVVLDTVQAMTPSHIDVLTAYGLFRGVQSPKSIKGHEPDGFLDRIHIPERTESCQYDKRLRWE